MVGFGFFFSCGEDAVPALDEVARLVPREAAVATRFTLGALAYGEWPVVGELPGWDRRSWRIPQLQRYDHLLQQRVLVEYADDPSEPVGEVPADPFHDLSDVPSDAIIGEGILADHIERELR
jgi:hypothetical protein